MSKHYKWLIIAALATSLVAVAGCGSGEKSSTSSNATGTIKIDGSSTVFPLTQAAAEVFKSNNPDVNISVGESGTGGGFEKFCAGETEISDASREIEPDEVSTCKKGGVENFGLQVANDGIAIVTNTSNTFVDCLTIDQLKKIWSKGSKINNWNQVDPKYPNKPLALYGPGTDSGTFDFFTKEIDGEEGNSRSDYTASENDNVLVKGIEGDEGGLGYFGFSYYEQNQDKLRLIAVDSGDGCKKPDKTTIQDGSYKPLSRPLFIYVSKSASSDDSAVNPFVTYYIDNAVEIADTAKLVPLTDEQLQKSKNGLEALSE